MTGRRVSVGYGVCFTHRVSHHGAGITYLGPWVFVNTKVDVSTVCICERSVNRQKNITAFKPHAPLMVAVITPLTIKWHTGVQTSDVHKRVSF